MNSVGQPMADINYSSSKPAHDGINSNDPTHEFNSDNKDQKDEDASTIKPVASHIERMTTFSSYHPKFQLSRKGGGDTALALFDNVDDVGATIDPAEERRIIRKVDWMLLPYISVCYIFFYVDKTTLSYAAIFGIKSDLHLVGTEYSWLSSIFYCGFLAFALPTNFMLQRFPIAKYLGVNIFLWGFFLMLQAVSKDFATLAVLRALGGAAEACADPAFILIMGMWYTREEQPIKIGIWYSANGLGVAAGGLLGYGIGSIKGALASWKYEFLIIGALCSAWGIVIFLFLPDSPVSTKLLSIDQKKIVVERLRTNQTGIENKELKWYQVREAFLDYKLYFFFLIALMQAIVNGGISNFGTLIIEGFNFSTLVTTLLQVPYGAIIFLVILLCVWLNIRCPTNNRCYLIILFLLPNIAGALGLRFVPSNQRVGRLICYYLTSSINASFAMLLSLQTANIAGHTKKVVTAACLFLGYCTGNIAGPFFYKSDQAPEYYLGIWSMIVAHLLEVVIVLALRFLLKWENQRRDRIQGVPEGELESAEWRAEREREMDATAFGDMTDRENLNFRYIY